MQDRSCQLDENLLRRTAGPYIRVMSVALCDRWLPIDFRYAPFATEVMRRCKMTRWANT